MPGRPALLPAAVFVVVLAALLPDLGGQHVWTKDEARPGLIARDVVERGAWLVPRIGGRLYGDKPPLFPWLVAALARPRVTEWSLRLPSAAAAAGTAAIVCALGARLGPPPTGLVAAAMLASALAFVEWGRIGRMEMLLVFWLTLAVWALVRWLGEGRRRHLAALALAIGGAFLTKGPIAILPVVAGILALLLTRRATVRRLAGLALAVALGLVLPAGWLAVAALASPDFGSYLAVILTRFSDEVQVQRERHVLYAARVLAVSFLPWTLLLPGALVVLWRAGQAAWRPLLPVLLWGGVVVTLFTAIISPREPYFLPAYPPLALVTARGWVAASARARAWMAVPLGAGLAVLVLGGLSLLAVPRTIEIHRLPVTLGTAAGVTVAAGALGVGAAAALLLRRGHVTAPVLTVAGGSAAAALGMLIAVNTPAANAAYATRPAAARVAAALGADGTVAYLDRKFAAAIVFYLPRPAAEHADVGALRAVAPRPGAHALVLESDLVFVASGVCLPAREVTRASVGRDAYVLADFRGTVAPWCLWPPGY